MAFFQYSPLYFWCRLQVVFPYVCGQGGVIFLASCPEAVGVVIEPSFEGQVSYSHILHFTATRALEVCFVYYTLVQASVFNWTVVPVSAVAMLCIAFRGF